MGRRSRKSKRRMNSLFMTLVLTAVMLIMSTYAWFSANRQVEITGITAKVRAAEGLQISLDGISWDTSVAISKDTLVALTSAVNNVAWADKLEPVSTDGTTSSSDGELNFYYGEVSADGSVLKDVKTTKSVSTTAIGGATGDTGPTNKYIAFDIYLKNSSSKALDDLQLANGSFIAITKDESKGKGQDNTGLEYSVRAALELYTETATFTDSQATVNGLDFGSPVVSIWEPNYDQHIGEIVRLDGRIDAATQAFNTMAMNSSSVGKNIQGVNGDGTEGHGVGDALSVTLDADGNVKPEPAGVSGTYMTIPYTIQTGGTVSGGEKQLYNVTGVGDDYKIKLPGNAISKARIYIWLEGQDPDCQDTASTGKSFDLQINLSKPAANS